MTPPLFSPPPPLPPPGTRPPSKPPTRPLIPPVPTPLVKPAIKSLSVAITGASASSGTSVRPSTSSVSTPSGPPSTLVKPSSRPVTVDSTPASGLISASSKSPTGSATVPLSRLSRTSCTEVMMPSPPSVGGVELPPSSNPPSKVPTPASNPPSKLLSLVRSPRTLSTRPVTLPSPIEFRPLSKSLSVSINGSRPWSWRLTRPSTRLVSTPSAPSDELVSASSALVMLDKLPLLGSSKALIRSDTGAITVPSDRLATRSCTEVIRP